MITAWILYAVVVGGLVGAGGLALESLARTHALPSRWIWTGALVLSVGWPFGHWGWENRAVDPPSVAAPTLSTQVSSEPAAVPPLQPGVVEIPRESILRRLDGPILGAWVSASTLLIVLVLLLVLRTRRLRGRWKKGDAAGHEVLYSDHWGPAVIGIIKPRIVLPRWCRDMDPRALRLILDHELEHIRAGDLRLITFTGFLPVLFPWHLTLWWQWFQLRTAVEGDCDLRVLGRNPGKTRPYVNLLLDVGKRSNPRHAMAAMLSEPFQTLKRRIRIMTMPLPKKTWLRGALLAGVAAVLVALACWAPGPTDARDEDPEAVAEAPGSGEGEALSEAKSLPVFTPYTVKPRLTNVEEALETLERAYTREMREAGIGGTVEAWFFVDEEGRVQRSQVDRSSGHRELDLAAIGLADRMEFSPALNRDRKTPTWVSLTFEFVSGDASQPQGGPARSAATDAGFSRILPVPEYSGPRGVVTGTVKSLGNGLPLEKVQVYVPGTGSGTLTNIDGTFLILGVPAGEREVVAELIGYGQEIQEVTVSTEGSVRVDFDLRTAAVQLGGLVVGG